jgi:hypothetical protein
MADTKISLLTALTAAAANDADVLPVVDTSATTTMKISLADVVEFVVASAVFATELESAGNPADSDQSVLGAAVFL